MMDKDDWSALWYLAGVFLLGIFAGLILLGPVAGFQLPKRSYYMLAVGNPEAVAEFSKALAEAEQNRKDADKNRRLILDLLSAAEKEGQ